MRIALAVMAAALLAACVRPDPRVAELERQLRERDREIAELRAQKAPAQPTSPQPEATADERAVVKGDDASQALEIALVRQGGSILPRWAIQVEPQLTYVYREADGIRRNSFVASTGLRAGLPWDLQADLFVPYVFYTERSDDGSTSHIGDVRVGLTKRLLQERQLVPELLLRGRWKTETGKSSGLLPTGSAGNALETSFTAVKTQEPLVFFATPFYSFSFGDDDEGFDPGDLAGGRLGVILSATPDTSLFVDVDVASSVGSQHSGSEFLDVSGVSGVVDLGLLTVVSKDTVLNVSAGIGFTTAAPDFSLAVSLPITHY
jgi:hypothetical protein